MKFTLKNKMNCKVVLSTLGARMVKWEIPFQNKVIDVIQGFDTEDEYFTKGKSQGAICGSYANRIENAEFQLDGIQYKLEKNNGEHCLHGGNKGLRTVHWQANQLSKNQIQFMYLSKHLENGFPGNVSISVLYSLTDENLLSITLLAHTDQDTILNLTSHPYFNLHGHDSKQTCLNDKLKLNANYVLPINETGIPTGELRSVENSIFDFRTAKPIREAVQSSHPQIQLVNGLDHCFVMNDFAKQIQFNASVNTANGIELTVMSDYPGVQVFTANTSNITGKDNAYYGQYSAICLEPQYFPNSPNEANFPSTILKKDELYQHSITYQISINE